MCGLESFTAPASLHKIGEEAFACCYALKHVDLSACTFMPDGDFLSKDAFTGSGVENIVFPSTLKVIGERLFNGCKNLRSITFGDNSVLEEIEALAFYECGLESFTAPPKLKKIGDLAFGHC